VTRARQALGAQGEAQAARWYEAQGYEVVARNWRCREGEIDLIVRLRRTIVFCEVKTRSSDAFGLPAEAVTRAKRERLRHLAAKWLEDSPIRAMGIRFDVASILDGQLEIIEGAF
jgi:putative endonuclease